MKDSKLVMYFLVLEDVPDNLVPVVCAHGSLMCYWTFESDPDMMKWRSSSFKKRVCRVNQKEFDKAKESGKFVKVTESTLNGRVVAVYSPRSSEWENVCELTPASTPVQFDSRVFVLPEAEVCNYFIWRQQDWERNSI